MATETVKKTLSPKKIGVIPLSSPINPDLLEPGIKELQRRGYEAVLPLDPTACYGTTDHLFATASVRTRSEALENLLSQPQISVILAARGGYGAAQVLPQLNWASLKKLEGKTLVGGSDFTSLLIAFYQELGITTVHGPMFRGFAAAGAGKDEQRSLDGLINLLRGEVTRPFGSHKLRRLAGSGAPSGKLLGGNLVTISSMVGTPWALKPDGHILFLEEIGETPHRVHRALQQLKLARAFDTVSAVILGDFLNCEYPDGRGPKLEQVFLELLGDLGIPIFSDAPFGHGKLNLSLPLGINAKIEENQLELMSTAGLRCL